MTRLVDRQNSMRPWVVRRRGLTRSSLVTLAALITVAGLAGAAPAVAQTTLAQQLLLPSYEVDTNDASGASTLFAVRNQAPGPLEVSIQYFAANAPDVPLRTDVVTIESLQVLPINVRDVPGLAVDADGFARGFAIIAGPDTGFTWLYGDYFHVTPDEAFATGDRLVNMEQDLCRNFSIRFLEGGAFTGGTELQLWIEELGTPLPPGLAYGIFAEEGGERLELGSFVPTPGITTVPVSELLTGNAAGLTAGVVEIYLDGLLRGHLAATYSAQGQFSVGLDAACIF